MKTKNLDKRSKEKKSWRSLRWYVGLFLAVVPVLVGANRAIAQSNAIAPSTLEFYINSLWLLIAGALVFFMNAGFAMLEAGLCRTNNAVNVLAKNLIVFCVSILAFWLLGFGLMFGNGSEFLGIAGFSFEPFIILFGNYFPEQFSDLKEIYSNHAFAAVFFFQLVFAGTTATIVSGAVAERIKFWAFFFFSLLLVGIAYPITGRWIWGPNGWLAAQNFLDFAGSTVVHSVGGMAGLTGALLLGPRRGWKGYDPESSEKNKFTDESKKFPPYNLTFSTLGCLILWLGWLGFNGGTAISIDHVPHIILTTIMAAASGGVFVLMFRGVLPKKPSLSLVINGILGGLVGITASSAYVGILAAIFIGSSSGFIVILIEYLLKQVNIDDPVGAIPVHLGCGIWGTLLTGCFVQKLEPYISYDVIQYEQIFAQLIGILSVNATILLLTSVFWIFIGLIIYLIESISYSLSLNSKQGASIKKQLYSSERDPEDSPVEFMVKYLKLAREALRVSKEDEEKGRDGIFERE